MACCAHSCCCDHTSSCERPLVQVCANRQYMHVYMCLRVWLCVCTVAPSSCTAVTIQAVKGHLCSCAVCVHIATCYVFCLRVCLCLGTFASAKHAAVTNQAVVRSHVCSGLTHLHTTCHTMTTPLLCLMFRTCAHTCMLMYALMHACVHTTHIISHTHMRARARTRVCACTTQHSTHTPECTPLCPRACSD